MSLDAEVLNNPNDNDKQILQLILDVVLGTTYQDNCLFFGPSLFVFKSFSRRDPACLLLRIFLEIFKKSCWRQHYISEQPMEDPKHTHYSYFNFWHGLSWPFFFGGGAWTILVMFKFYCGKYFYLGCIVLVIVWSN